MIVRRILASCFLGWSLSSLAASHNPQQLLDAMRGAPDEGEQIVQAFCANCHAPKAVIELGAPKQGQIEAWQPRIKQGLDVLFKHTEEGIGAMPPRGGCFECSDEQLRLAIAALLPESEEESIKKTER